MLFSIRFLGGFANVSACFALVVMLTPGALVADITWNGARNEKWSTKGNWERDTLPTVLEKAVFAGKGATRNRVVIDAPVTVAGLIFNTWTPDPFSLESEEADLTLDSGATDRVPVIRCNASNGVTLEASLVIQNEAGAESVISGKQAVRLGEEGKLTCNASVLVQPRNAEFTFEGELAGKGPFLAVQGGVLNLAGNRSNTFTGMLQVRQDAMLVLAKQDGKAAYGGRSLRTTKNGIIKWQDNNQIGDASSIALGGGQLVIGAQSDQVGTLVLNKDAAIVFSEDGPGRLEFKNSSQTEKTWKGKTLTIENYQQGRDALRFGQNDKGLTPTQLACIRFGEDTPAVIDASGYVTPKP